MTADFVKVVDQVAEVERRERAEHVKTCRLCQELALALEQLEAKLKAPAGGQMPLRLRPGKR